MILVDILSLTYIPLTNGFSLRADQIYSDTDKSIRAFVTFFSVTDIVLNFITGYYDVTNEINNDYGKIALYVFLKKSISVLIFLFLVIT